MIVRGPKNVFVDFVDKICVFVSRQMKIAIFPRENGDPTKLVVDFLLGKRHVPK